MSNLDLKNLSVTSKNLQDALLSVSNVIEEVQDGKIVTSDEAIFLCTLIERATSLRDNSIRFDHSKGMSQKQLAVKYSLTQTQLWPIVNVPYEVISNTVLTKSKDRLLELGMSAFTDNRGVRIVETLRKRIANAGMGVTLQGTFLTVRFSEGKALQQVSMQINSIVDSEVEEED